MTTMTSATDLARRLFDVIDGQRWDDYETVVHPDVEMVSPFGVFTSAADWAAFSQGFAVAIPDGKHTVNNVLQDGDNFALTGTWTGTHTGPLSTPAGTVPPTGLAVQLPFCAMATARDGRVAHVHVYLDQLALLTQLGLAPAADR